MEINNPCSRTLIYFLHCLLVLPFFGVSHLSVDFISSLPQFVWDKRLCCYLFVCLMLQLFLGEKVHWNEIYQHLVNKSAPMLCTTREYACRLNNSTVSTSDLCGKYVFLTTKSIRCENMSYDWSILHHVEPSQVNRTDDNLFCHVV